MLFADFVIGPHDGPLEQAPDAFNRVCMNAVASPFRPAVLDCLMLPSGGAQVAVANVFVTVDGLYIVTDELLKELAERLPSKVALLGLDNHVAAALHRAHKQRLVAAFGVLALLLGKALRPGVEKRFVDFDNARQHGVWLQQGLTYTMTQVPSRLVTNLNHPLNLVGTDGLLRFHDHIDGQKPLPQRQVGIVHDRPRRYGELVAA